MSERSRLLQAIPARGSICLEALRRQLDWQPEPVLGELAGWKLVSLQRRDDGGVSVARTPDAADYLRFTRSLRRRA